MSRPLTAMQAEPNQTVILVTVCGRLWPPTLGTVPWRLRRTVGARRCGEVSTSSKAKVGMNISSTLARYMLLTAMAAPVIALAQTPGQSAQAPSTATPQPRAMACPCGDMAQSAGQSGHLGMSMMAMHESMHRSGGQGPMMRHGMQRERSAPQSAGRVGDVSDYPR